LEIYLVALVAGIVGAFFMDLAEFQLERAGYSSGVSAMHVGRWFINLLKGKFKHKNIETCMPVNYEIQLGIVFHFIIGGGVVALLYPLFTQIIELQSLSSHLLAGISYGLLTSVLPWFILMPSFGWGWFGLKTPFESEPVVTPLLSHAAYGLGIAVVFILYEIYIL